METKSSPLSKWQAYNVSGMHCASCEVLIEKKLLEQNNIKAVQATAGKNQVSIAYEGEKPSLSRLNRLFENDGYLFTESSKETHQAGGIKNNWFGALVTAGLIIAAFILVSKSSFGSLVNVTSQSALPLFFVFGLLAGVSTCAALVGGIVLSMSKQWASLYSVNNNTWERLQPHLMFNTGRLAAYAIGGFILGLIGNRLQISLGFTSLLVLAASLLMLFFGLQMLGLKAFQKFQITLPKTITRKISDEKKFQGKFLPAAMGALTLFLPCGFTLTTQGLALISGNPMRGSLIMFLFALGTVLPLLAIGLSSVKFSKNHSRAEKFSKTAGILVLFFALFNINAQLNVLGLPSLDNFSFSLSQTSQEKTKVADKDLPPIINGRQIIKMEASSSGYKPNYFKVRAGVPVYWEINDAGTSGCTNAIISKNLFSGQIDLVPGKISAKEFIPRTPGRYKFSCWMGMISGTIDVIGT